MAQERWPLVAALAWLATGDETFAERLGAQDIEAAEVALAVRQAMPGSTETTTLQDAWEDQVAPAMARGDLIALGEHRTVHALDGVSAVCPSVVFPPSRIPTTALGHELKSGDRGETLIVPKGSVGQHRVIVWADVTVAADDIRKLRKASPPQKVKQPVQLGRPPKIAGVVERLRAEWPKQDYPNRKELQDKLGVGRTTMYEALRFRKSEKP